MSIEKKISFLIIGAQKSGTTALDKYLREHPKIILPKNKELHFFDNETFFKEKVDYAIYHKNFPKKSNNKILGEATPIYLYWNSSIKRIWHYNPAIKLIIILRNPIERAYSHWNMEYRKKKETLSFLEAIKKEKSRLKEIYPRQHRVYSYIDRGFYTKQIRDVYQFFNKKQVLILKHEDLKDNYQETLNKVVTFLELPHFNFQELYNIHQGVYSHSIDKQSYQYLYHTFENEIKNLEKMLQWDCSSWLKKKE